MDTRGKSNAEFRNEVNEILGRHETSFDQVNATLQVVLTELQALLTNRPQNTNSPEINPFSNEESSHQQTPHRHPINNHQHHTLKLSFPKFNGMIQQDGSTKQNNILSFKILCQTSSFSWPLSI
jgi:hypothetical protein